MEIHGFEQVHDQAWNFKLKIKNLLPKCKSFYLCFAFPCFLNSSGVFYEH